MTSLQGIRNYSSRGAIVRSIVFLLVSAAQLLAAAKFPLLARDARNGAPWKASEPDRKYPPTIVFMTDFGVLDDSVAICRGVMYGIMPDLRIVDLTHQVTPVSVVDW